MKFNLWPSEILLCIVTMKQHVKQCLNILLTKSCGHKTVEELPMIGCQTWPDTAVGANKNFQNLLLCLVKLA